MMAEQRTKAGRTHWLAASAAFQADEQGGRVDQRAFCAQIMSQGFEDICR
jgi:hypothetical protein